MALLWVKEARRFEDLVHLCIFWIVWKERNQRSFDNEEHLDHYLKSSFLGILFSWGKMHIETGCMSLFNFVEWLGPC